MSGVVGGSGIAAESAGFSFPFGSERCEIRRDRGRRWKTEGLPNSCPASGAVSEQPPDRILPERAYLHFFASRKTLLSTDVTSYLITPLTLNILTFYALPTCPRAATRSSAGSLNPGRVPEMQDDSRSSAGQVLLRKTLDEKE